MAQIHPVIESPQLLDALRQCDARLDLWIGKSHANACLFLEDPAAAMQTASQSATQAANAGLDLDVMLELEAVLSGLAQKLDLSVSRRPQINIREAS
jgi:hypothetical protein